LLGYCGSVAACNFKMRTTKLLNIQENHSLLFPSINLEAGPQPLAINCEVF
jgi:hypothetical protein